MLETGTRLGPYKIEHLIGAGGMGEVYRARDERLDRDVAIKVLAPKLVNDPEAMIRFEKEAKAVAALSHPNILAIHYFDREKDTYFTASELLEGETLRSRITHAPLPWRKAIEIGISIAQGLSAAHSKGIIHRDLKPENIFLTSDGQVKILDFGLAAIRKQPEKIGPNETPISAAETDEAILGTLGYISPEQVRGASVDARSDLFALGCILHEMVTGKRAFARETVYETMAAVLKDEPPEVSELGVQIPVELQRLIHHCLEKNPVERVQSAHDLAFDLKAMIATHESSSAVNLAQNPRTRSSLWMVLLVALAMVSVAVGFYLRQSRPVESIAVLPFTNSPADPNMDYLSDGVTESIINNLSQVANLRVMARSTVFRYKAKNLDVEEIARQLKVDAVLIGNLAKRGDDLVVRTELVNARDGSQLWGQSYNETLTGLLPVQQEIAQQILHHLQVKLSGQQQARVMKKQTVDSEAYRLYLQGRYFWNKRTAEGLKLSVNYFQQAIQQDVSYARAYSGLADAYILQGLYGVTDKEVFGKAKTAVLKALELDPELGEAHATLAYLYVFNWEWKLADKEFQRAIQLNPGYATGHQWYSNYLAFVGRTDESLAEIRKAQDLDPLSLVMNEVLGAHLYLARKYEEAIAQFHKTLELDSNFALAHYGLGFALIQTGQYEKAISAFQTSVRLAGEYPDNIGGLAYAYARAGKHEQAREILRKLLDMAKTSYVSPVQLGAIYMALGQNDEAITYFRTAYEQHAEIFSLKADPIYDPLRNDPRFQEVLRLIGL